MSVLRVPNESAMKFAATIRASGLPLLAIACACLSGCISQEDRSQMAQADSILAPIFKSTTPADAAAWAADPYDPDKRARGMNLLANAPFGSADVYVNMYRERL